MKPRIKSGHALAEAYLHEYHNNLDALLTYLVANDLRETDWLELKAALYPTQEDVDAAVSALRCTPDFAHSLHCDDCLWQVMRAILSLANTTGGMVVIGIDEHDLSTPLPLADASLHAKFGDRFVEGYLVQNLLFSKKFRSITDRSSKDSRPGAPAIFHHKLGEELDGVRLVMAQARGTPVIALLVEARSDGKMIAETCRPERDGREEENVWRRTLGDVGRCERLKVSNAFAFREEVAQQQKSDRFGSLFRAIRKSLHPVASRTTRRPRTDGRDNGLKALPREAFFFGRDEELAMLLKNLAHSSRVRYITISGQGGHGKTSLAIEAAYLCDERARTSAALAHEYGFDKYVMITARIWKIDQNGALVECPREISSLDDILQRLLRVLAPGLRQEKLDSLQKRQEVVTRLNESRVLLILDNLETIEDRAIQDFFSEIASISKIIVTDREYASAGMPLVLERLPDDKCVDMLRHYLREMQAESRLTQAELEQLAGKSGGIPRIVAWVANLVGRQHRSTKACLDILSNNQDVYRSIYDWSFDHLDEPSLRLVDILFTLQSPADLSLLSALLQIPVQAVEDSAAEPRRLTIATDQRSNGTGPRLSIDLITRQYIAQRRTRIPRGHVTDVDVALRLVAYLESCCGSDGWIRDAAEPVVADALEHIEWAFGVFRRHGDVGGALRLMQATAAYLWHFGYAQLLLNNAQDLLERIDGDDARAGDRARLLVNTMGWVYFNRQVLDDALAAYEAGLDCATRVGDPVLRALAKKGIAQVHKERAEKDKEEGRTILAEEQFALARRLTDEAIEEVGRLGPTQALAVLYGTLSSIHRDLGDRDTALELLKRNEDIARKFPANGEIRTVAMQKRVRLLLEGRELDEAERINRQTRQLHQKAGHKPGVGHAEIAAARIHEMRGDLARAFRQISVARRIFVELGMEREVRKDYERIEAAYRVARTRATAAGQEAAG